jgi:hypothetical protein
LVWGCCLSTAEAQSVDGSGFVPSLAGEDQIIVSARVTTPVITDDTGLIFDATGSVLVHSPVYGDLIADVEFMHVDGNFAIIWGRLISGSFGGSEWLIVSVIDNGHKQPPNEGAVLPPQLSGPPGGTLSEKLVFIAICHTEALPLDRGNFVVED